MLGYNYHGLNNSSMFRLARKRFKKHLSIIAITTETNEYEFIFQI